MKTPYHRRRLFALLLTAIAGPAAAQEAPAIDIAWTTRAIAEARSLRDDSIFGAGLPLTSFGRDRARIEQEARGKLGPLNLLATVTASGQEGAKPDTRFVAHEAYVDFTLGGERFSAGRKVLSGDVGYAFRPLDVLQRESRLQLVLLQGSLCGELNPLEPLGIRRVLGGGMHLCHQVGNRRVGPPCGRLRWRCGRRHHER
jgi:hypothetical protein